MVVLVKISSLAANQVELNRSGINWPLWMVPSLKQLDDLFLDGLR